MPFSNPEQKRIYQKNWIARRRKEWLNVHGPCVDCGSWDNLEVDHVNPAIKVTHKVWSWTASRREEELNKCVVRCESCHSKRTKSQRSTIVCINGHNKKITGQDSWNRECSECRRIRQRKHGTLA